MTRWIISIGMACLVSMSGGCGRDGVAMKAAMLRCEYLENPSGIGETAPRLSWLLDADGYGRAQTAYRILVASSPEILAADNGDLWDTGKRSGDETAYIVYSGKPLSSRVRCHWKVMVWDENGRPSQWSEPAEWSVGLLDRGDWRATWIAGGSGYAAGTKRTDPGMPVAMMRYSFTIVGAISRATLYVTSRGMSQARLNGARIGDDVFAPEWTDYAKRIQYRTYDVTELMRTGDNALGVLVADGWYSGFVGGSQQRGTYGLVNSLLLQLEIEHPDGSRETIVSDGGWKWAEGPIRSSDLQMGETYDARLEMPGWDSPGFDDGAWKPVAVVEAPAAVLVAQPSQPVRSVMEIAPVGMTQPVPGVYVFDLGQNIAGWVRLRVSGAAGTTVTMRHGERLAPDGTVYTENLRAAAAVDRYTLKGEGVEVYEPSFTFHGFQYVEVAGYPGTPGPDAVTGCVVHSDIPVTGSFSCSNEMVNRLVQNIAWGQRGNFLSVPTDCPQRDERLGWMGDAQTFAGTAAYNMDVAAFFTKWMTDVSDAQAANGAFSDFAPYPWSRGDNPETAPAWGDAGIIVPWTAYCFYGDTRIVERNWQAMERWMAFMGDANPDHIRRNRLGADYGDWLSIGDDTPKYLLATAFWANDARCMAEMADAIGRADDAARYRGLYDVIRAAFMARYVAADGRVFPQDGDLERTGAYAPSHVYTGGIGESQTGYLLALAFDLLPDTLRSAAAGNLVRKIRDNGWHLSSGFVGVRFLNPVLSAMGHDDVAYRLLLADTYPSWLYPVRNGATTIWERWDGWTEERGFQDPSMNSFNHYSLGSVGAWLYGYAAGIRPDPATPGFKRIVIEPHPGAGLEWVKASYRSIHGMIESAWSLDGDTFTLDVTVPPNTTAVISMPCGDARITKPAESPNPATPLGVEQGKWRVVIPSGSYTFVGRMEKGQE